MAKDILIVPGSSNIQFSGSAANNIKLETLDSGSVAFTSNSGSLLTITNSLTGSLFSVGDVSGVPILDVNSDDTVTLGQFSSPIKVLTNSSGNTIISGSSTSTGSFGKILGDVTIPSGKALKTSLIKGGSDVEVDTEGAHLKLTASDLRLANGQQIEWNNANTRILASHASNYMRFDIGGVSNVLYLTNGKVGIGTATPSTSRRLHIHNTDDTRGIYVYNSSATSYAEIHIQANREFRIGTGGASSAAEAQNNFYVYDATAAAHRFTIDSSGNVGIGTTSPGAKLEVKGGDVSTSLVIRAGGSTGGIRFYDSGGTTDGYIQAGDGYIGFLDMDGHWGVRHVSNSKTEFRVNNSVIANVTAAGIDVGVGVSNVGLYLGNSNSRIYFGGARAIEGGSSGTMQIGEGFSTLLLQANTTVQGNMTVTGTLTAQEFITELNTVTIIESSGSTKFGNTNDDLHQFTGSMKIQRGDDVGLTLLRGGQSVAFLGDLGSQNDGGLILYNESGATTTLLRTKAGLDSYMNTTGNFGLGTNSPGRRLDVVGTGRFSGKLNLDAAESLELSGIRGQAVGSQTGDFIQLYERVSIGNPSGWGHSSAGAPQYGLSVYGSVQVGRNGSGVLQMNGTTVIDASRNITNAGTGTFSGQLNANGSLVVTGTSTFNIDGDSSFYIVDAGTNAVHLKSAASDEIYFGSNNTWQLRFDGSGAAVHLNNGVDFVPDTDSSSALGTTSKRFSNLFTDAATIGGTLNVGTISTTGNFSTTGNISSTATSGNNIFNSSVLIAAGKHLFLDGGSNTYLTQGSADVIDIYTGGTIGLKVNASEIQVQRYITHAGDTNTYIDFETDTIGFVTAGSDALKITSAQNVYVPNGKFGVGTNSPNVELDIRGQRHSWGTGQAVKRYAADISGLADGSTAQYYTIGTIDLTGLTYSNGWLEGWVTQGRSFQDNPLYKFKLSFFFSTGTATVRFRAKTIGANNGWLKAYVDNSTQRIIKLVAFNNFANQVGMAYDIKYYNPAGASFLADADISFITSASGASSTSAPSGYTVVTSQFDLDDYSNRETLIGTDGNGKVGIGTSNVQTATKLELWQGVGNGSSYDVMAIDGNTGNYGGMWISGVWAAGQRGRIGFYATDTSNKGVALIGGSGTTPHLYVDGSGRVGIGTTSPDTSRKLTLFGANAALSIKDNGGSHTFVDLHDGSDHGYLIKNSGTATTNGALAGGLYTYVASGKSFQHIVNGSPKFTILSGGNVGIGTTSPDSMLEVRRDETSNQSLIKGNINYSAITIQGDYTQGSYLPALSWATGDNVATAPKASIYIHTDQTGSTMILGTSNAYSNGVTNDGLCIDPTGQIGIGTQSPIRMLDIVVGSGDPGIRLESASQSADVITLRNSDGRVEFGSNKLTVFGDNVGVSNVNPSVPLNIGGNTSGINFDYMPSWNSYFIGQNVKRSTTNGRMVRAASDATRFPVAIAFGYQDVAGFGSADSKGGINFITVGSNLSGDIDPETYSRMYIHKDGNIGIGTVVPKARLQVHRQGATLGQWTHTAIGIHNDTTNNTYSQLGFGFTGATNNAPAVIAYHNQSATAYGQGSLIFGLRNSTSDAAPTERMRVQYDGKVGIGSTTPQQALDVVGGGAFTTSVFFNGRVRINNDGQVHWGAAYNQGYLSWDTNKTYMGSIGSNALHIQSDSSDAIIIDTSQNTKFINHVSIQNGKYLNFLDTGGNAHFRIFQNSSDILEINSVAYGGAVFTVDATGGGVNVPGNLDVGAGLDVTGNITVSGTVDGVDIASLSAGAVQTTGNQTIGGTKTLSSSPIISGGITFSGTSTISTAGGSDSLSINPDANLHLGTASTDHTFIGATGRNVTLNPTTLTINASQTNMGNTQVAGNLTVTGTVTAEVFETETVVKSIITSTGSTKFGNSSDDTHEMTGSLLVDNGPARISKTLGANTTLLQLDNKANNAAYDTHLDFTVANGATTVSRIASNYDGSNDIGMSFHTFNSNGLGERMRITKEGYVGIGTTTISAALDVNNADGVYTKPVLAVRTPTQPNAIKRILKGYFNHSASTGTYFRVRIPQAYQTLHASGGHIKVTVIWQGYSASRSTVHCYEAVYHTNHGFSNNEFFGCSEFTKTYDQQSPLSYSDYEYDVQPTVTFGRLNSNGHGGLRIQVQGYASYAYQGAIEVEVNGNVLNNACTLENRGTTADSAVVLGLKDQTTIQVTSAGNVGIGTNNPQGQNANGPILHLFGADSTDEPQIVFQQTGESAMAIGVNGNIDGGSAMMFYTNGSNNRMTIREDGKIGIGTNDPGVALLSVRSTTAGAPFLYVGDGTPDNSGGWDANIQLDSNQHSRLRIEQRGDNKNLLITSHVGYNPAIFAADSATGIRMGVGGTTSLTIGTNPYLNINGETRIATNLTFSNASTNKIYRTNDGGYLQLRGGNDGGYWGSAITMYGGSAATNGGNSGAIQFWNVSNTGSFPARPTMVMYPGVKVGIGTSTVTSGRQLEVASDTDTYIQISTNNAGADTWLKFRNDADNNSNTDFRMGRANDGRFVFGDGDGDTHYQISSTGEFGIGADPDGILFRAEKSINGNWAGLIKNTHASNGYGLKVQGGDDANVTSFQVNNASDSLYFVVRGDGNVGIGAAPTGGKLHVAGNIYATGTLETGNPLFNLASTTVNGYAHGLQSFVSTSGGWARAFRWFNNVNATARQTTFNVGATGGGSGTSYGYLSIGDQASDSTGYSITKAIRLYSDGDVTIPDGGLGIGNNSPDTKLHISNAGSIELRLEADTDNSGQEDCFIRFYTDNKTQEGIVGMDNNNGASSTLFSGNTENAMVFGTVSNLPTIFATNDTERVHIAADGEVGIGTNNPSAKLHIYGGSWNTQLTIQNDNENNNGIRFMEDGGTINGYVYGRDPGIISFLDPNGNYAYRYTHNSSHGWYINNSEKMRLDSSGRLGIGDLTPSAQLEVARAGSQVARFYNTNGDANGTSVLVGAVKMLDTNVYHIGGIVSKFANSAWLSAQVDLKGPASTGYGDGITYLHFNHDGSNQRSVFTGRVGIGVAAPTAQMEIYGDGTSINQLRLRHTGSGSNGVLDLSATSTIANIIANYSSTAIPLRFLTGAAERVRIDTSGRVGIGTASPTDFLHIYGGSGSTINFDTNGSSNWRVGATTSGGGYSTGNAFAWYCFDSSAYEMTLDTGGRLGIGGIISPQHTLHINGDQRIHNGSLGIDVSPSTTDGVLRAGNDVVAYFSSDERLKENVKQIENPIEKVKQLRGVEFDWIVNEKIHPNEGHDIGVIAQDVEKVLPEIVETRKSGYKAVKYEKMVSLLIESVKEQQKQIEELKSEIQELKDGSSK